MMRFLQVYHVGHGEKECVNTTPVCVITKRASAPRMSVAEQVNFLLEQRLNASRQDEEDDEDFDFEDDPFEIYDITYDGEDEQDVRPSLSDSSATEAGAPVQTTEVASDDANLVERPSKDANPVSE